VRVDYEARGSGFGIDVCAKEFRGADVERMLLGDT
jgi:hypothetical protein